MKSLWLTLLAAGGLQLAACSQTTPIHRGKLLSNLDGNEQSITNVHLSASDLTRGTVGSAVLTGSNAYNGSFTGDGGGLTNLNSSLALGSNNWWLATNVPAMDTSHFLTNLDARSWTNWTGIYGNGVGLTNLNGSTLTGTMLNTVGSVVSVGGGGWDSGQLSSYAPARYQGHFYGYSKKASAGSTYNGVIALGNPVLQRCATLDFDGDNHSLYLDNYADNTNAVTKLRMRVAGTPMDAMTIKGTGNTTFRGNLTASNGFSSDQTVFTWMPTNTPTPGDALVAAGDGFTKFATLGTSLFLTNLDTRGWTNNTGIYGNAAGVTNIQNAGLTQVTALSLQVLTNAMFWSTNASKSSFVFGNTTSNALAGNGNFVAGRENLKDATSVNSGNVLMGDRNAYVANSLANGNAVLGYQNAVAAGSIGYGNVLAGHWNGATITNFANGNVLVGYQNARLVKGFGYGNTVLGNQNAYMATNTGAGNALSGSDNARSAWAIGSGNALTGSGNGYSSTNFGSGNVLLGYQNGYNAGSIESGNVLLGMASESPFGSTLNGVLNIGSLIFGTDLNTNLGASYGPSGGKVGINTTNLTATLNIGGGVIVDADLVIKGAITGNGGASFSNNVTVVGAVQTSAGLLVTSNSWQTVPTLAEGENWYCSSNGVPHVVWKVGGILTTNRLVP